MNNHGNRVNQPIGHLKSVALLLLAGFLLLPIVGSVPVEAGELSGNGTLFLIKDEAGKGIEALKDLPIELYQKIPPHYLVATPAASRGVMSERGFTTTKELGWIEPGNSLYLLTRPGGQPLGSNPSAGEVLFRGDSWFLVEASEDLIDVFGREGFKFSIVPLRPLPMENPKIVAPFSYGQASLPSGVREKRASSDSTIAAYIQRLQDFQTRYSYSDSVVAAAEWIHDTFIDFGFTDVAYDSFQANGRWQRNVVATKPGTVNPDKVIVIGGHYDSVTYSGLCDPMIWAPGADDNASGTALTMDMARVLAGIDTEITLKFVPFAAEEQGLHGSYHFAEEAFNSGMDIVLMINMDMVGWNPDPFLNVGINTDSQSMAYAEIMSQIAQDSTTLIPQIRNSGGGSDHYAFQQYGFNHVYVDEGDFNFTHWHQCSDSLGNLDVSYMAQIVDMILPTIILVANAPGTPTGLAATDFGDGERMGFDWDASVEPDLVGYRVFSGPAPGEYDNVDTSFVNSFLIEGLTEGESLYVAVSAIDTDGYESPQSDPVGAIPLVRPRAPANLEMTSQTDRIDLGWTANEEVDVEGYIVYRTERGGGSYSPIDTLTASETSYSDQNAQALVYYLYQVTAFDSSNAESDPSLDGRGRLATHDSGILVIDATKDGTGAPFSPTDEDVDLFYAGLLEDFNLMAEWDYADSVAVARRPVDADMAIYSTVILHRDDRFGESIEADTLNFAKHLESGGNLLLGGWSLLADFAGGDQAFQAGSFFYDYLKIASFNTTRSSDMDFIGAKSSGGGYSDISIDAAKVPTSGLFSLHVFDSDPVAGEEIYTYSSSDSAGSQYQGMGMGVEYVGGGYGTVLLNFPLYYMDEVEAASLMSTAMTNLGEGPSLVDGDGSQGGNLLPRVFSLGQNYPNPFNPSTTITYAIPDGASEVLTRVSIYDLRGRLINRIVDEKKSPGYYQVHWNGRDQDGSQVSSGVYLYTIEAGDYSSTRKMVVVR